MLPFVSLVSSAQLTPDIVDDILTAAEAMHSVVSAKRRTALLADTVVALIFLEPSSRTMLSFQAAAQRLNAGTLLVHGKESTSLAKGESIQDTMKLVSGYADLIVARLPATGAAIPAAAACSVPFINAGDGANEHPTQSLIDLYTIRRDLGTLEGPARRLRVRSLAFAYDPLAGQRSFTVQGHALDLCVSARAARARKP